MSSISQSKRLMDLLALGTKAIENAAAYRIEQRRKTLPLLLELLPCRDSGDAWDATWETWDEPQARSQARPHTGKAAAPTDDDDDGDDDIEAAEIQAEMLRLEREVRKRQNRARVEQLRRQLAELERGAPAPPASPEPPPPAHRQPPPLLRAELPSLPRAEPPPPPRAEPAPPEPPLPRAEPPPPPRAEPAPPEPPLPPRADPEEAADEYDTLFGRSIAVPDAIAPPVDSDPPEGANAFDFSFISRVVQEAAAQVEAPAADALPLDEQRLNDQFYQLFGPSLPTANSPDEIAPQLEPPEPAPAAPPEPEAAEPAPALNSAPSPVVEPLPTPQGHDTDDPDLSPDLDPVRAQLQEQIRALEQEPSAANDDPQRLQNLIEANRIHWKGTRKTLWAGSALAACLRMSVRIAPPADRVALAQEAHRVAARAFQLSESAPRFRDLITCHNVLARTLHDAGQTTKALQIVRSGFAILRATAPRLRVGGHDQVTEMRQLLKIFERSADHP